MRLDYLVITISILCGAIFWIADTVFDYSYYGDQISFLNLLINDVPNHEVHLRPIILMCFLVFGFFVLQVLTKARKTELALKESQKRLQNQNDLLNSVLESLTYPFFVVDVNDYSIKMANSSTRQNGTTSTESYCYNLAHKNMKPCGESGETCLIDEIKKTKAPAMFEHIHYDEIRNPRNIEVYGFPIIDAQGNVVQIIEYCIDVTKRKQAEMSLEREKEQLAVTLRSIGDGIHDFNNALMSIMGNISLAITHSDLEEIGKKLEDAERTCLKARDLTKQLLILSKGEVPIKKTELISDFIKES